ncbi:MAG: hypothetical protein OHK0011_26940 [Turneriella sp.]
MFIKDVANVLKKNGIPFAIVGGYAIALHGIARGTFDLDIVTELSEQNLAKIEATLLSMGMQPLLPVTAVELYRNLATYRTEKNLIAWNFRNPNRLRDSLDVIITEDLRELEVIEAQTDFGKVPVLSIDSLIRMKSRAKREQDLKDIAALEALKRGRH